MKEKGGTPWAGRPRRRAGRPPYPQNTLSPEVYWLHDDIRVKDMPWLAVENRFCYPGNKDITEKLELYFAHRVESVWIVQPTLQAIAIYRPGISRPQLFTEGEVKDPATGLTARMEDIFAYTISLDQSSIVRALMR